MVILIVAGGAGTRLWPLSTPEYPKHLLCVTGERSLLQNTFDRAKRITSIEKIYVTTGISHSDHIISQLPELDLNNIVIEPARRDTMPCILNAIQIISSRHPHDEPIASIHADHHIRDIDGFVRGIMQAGRIASRYKKICLVGIEPTQPDTKYGYIQKADIITNEENVYNIKSFKEKPAYERARQYFESGEFFWNAGYFVAPYAVFKQAIREYAGEHWQAQLSQLESVTTNQERSELYLGFQKEAIDTALMEKVPDLLVIPSSFDWMDVGSFDDVYHMSSQNHLGNATAGQDIHIIDSEHVYVRNDCDQPVAVIGLDNVTVVHTEHGLLVMRTDKSQKVKDIVAAMKEQENNDA